MPATDYSKGYIYKLCSSVDDEIYIGSSCGPPHKRLWQHKYAGKMHPNQRVYAHLNAIGWENVRIIIIKPFPCSNLHELQMEEQRQIIKLKAALNTQLPCRGPKESDAASTRKRLSMKYQCGCGGKASVASAAQHELSERHQRYLAWGELNAIDVQEFSDTYVEDRAKEFQAIKRCYNKTTCQKKYVCGCGGHTSAANKSVHVKSRRHQVWAACGGLNNIDINAWA